MPHFGEELRGVAVGSHNKSASCGFAFPNSGGKVLNSGSEKVGGLGEMLSSNLRSSFEEPPGEGDYILGDENGIHRDEEDLEGFNTYSVKESFSSADHNVQVVNLEVLEDSIMEKEVVRKEEEAVEQDRREEEQEELQITPRAPLISEMSPRVENKRYTNGGEVEKTPEKYKDRYSFRSPEIVQQTTNYTSHGPSESRERGREVLEIELGDKREEEKEDEDMERLKADEGEVMMLRNIGPKEVLTPGKLSRSKGAGRLNTVGDIGLRGSSFRQNGKVVGSNRNGRLPPWKRCKCKSFYEMVWEYRAGEENSSLGVISESLNEERKEEGGKRADNSLNVTVSE